MSSSSYILYSIIVLYVKKAFNEVPFRFLNPSYNMCVRIFGRNELWRKTERRRKSVSPNPDEEASPNQLFALELIAFASENRVYIEDTVVSFLCRRPAHIESSN